MYRALLVEDEPSEAERLTSLVGRWARARGVEVKFTWFKSAMEMLSIKGRYDLCFLDIDLPGINGMEAAQLLRVYDETTPIIFVTNLAQFVVKGYEVNACGFIVKPVSYGSLSMNLDRAFRTIRQNVGRAVAVSTEEGVRVVPFNDIVYVEVSGHNLTYHLERDGEVRTTRGTLGQLVEDFSDAPIIRLSKSCVANMEKVARLKGDVLRTTTGDELHVSRTRRREVADALTDYLGGRR